MVRIVALCTQEDLPVFQQGIQRYSHWSQNPVCSEIHQERMAFLEALRQGMPWNLMIVAAPGARGLEAAVSARENSPRTPLLWCSNDEDFAAFSYRLRCSLFLPLPLEAEQVESALFRCMEPYLVKNAQ